MLGKPLRLINQKLIEQATYIRYMSLASQQTSNIMTETQKKKYKYYLCKLVVITYGNMKSQVHSVVSVHIVICQIQGRATRFP